mgnify:FL=1
MYDSSHINRFVKSYKIDAESKSNDSKFCLIKQQNELNNEYAVNVLDLNKKNANICTLIRNSLAHGIDKKVYLVDNSNDVEKYNNLIVTDYFDNDGQQIIISPFSEIAHIFVNDNSISELLKNEYNRQKIMNAVNKNDDFKKFIDNVYKYKIASIYNEKDKQKISKERIREQYVSLICDVLEKITNRH